MNQRFKIYERAPVVYGQTGGSRGMAEVIFSYPDFKSVEEGLKYIREVLDWSYTGKYGIVDTQPKEK